MNKVIPVTSGTGSGPTLLSAFDHALFEAGIGNFNLIPLSSVIPLDHEPLVQKVDLNAGDQGNRLYVVKAVNDTDRSGQTVAAGLGWVMTESETAWGLFVEHIGATTEDVHTQIEQSLSRMMAYRVDEDWSNIQSHVIEASCNADPVAVVVAAIFQSEDWG